MDSARGFWEVRGLLSSRDVLTDKCAFVLHELERAIPETKRRQKSLLFWE